MDASLILDIQRRPSREGCENYYLKLVFQAKILVLGVNNGSRVQRINETGTKGSVIAQGQNSKGRHAIP